MQRLIAKSQVGVNYVWVTCGNARADNEETTATSYRARDSVTGYAALRDTVTSRHTGPDQEEFFPPKLTMMGLTNWHHFWLRTSELTLANISQDGDSFPYFFKAINCKISG